MTCLAFRSPPLNHTSPSAPQPTRCKYLAQYYLANLFPTMPDLAPDGPIKGKGKVETSFQPTTVALKSINSSLTDPSPTTPGLLSPLGDPLGLVLNKALLPLGHVVGAVGKPNGDALLAVQQDAKEKMGGVSEEEEEKEAGREKREGELGGKRIGGNAQTGGNPLGL
ncbi:hypothetical protein LTR62_008474 [Meristemomyces frigidus]|uniref:Uncharacterized protein n=1 Tax=Meristemomyces frigidus TaxID=1508187 RepID=A0AAN7YSY1_9PEZI|nr:hypothetical protein LTR62_008474 [Meristemomyces frigidus]